MRALIAEDEFTSRRILAKLLTSLFTVDQVVNGQEAVEAVELALKESEPYDLVFMDIMMPVMDGIQALEHIRDLEQRYGADSSKVIMTTCLSDPKTVIRAFHDGQAQAYLVKPLEKEKLFAELAKLGLMSE